MSNAGEQFTAIYEKLKAEDKRKNDIIIPMNSLTVNPDFTFEGEDIGKVRMTDYAFSQLCQQVYGYPLPTEYFRKLYEESPEVFANQLNYHLQNGKDVKRKFRTVKDEIGNQSLVRGIVSPKYIPYDNIDVLSMFVDTASKKLPDFEVQKMHTDEKMMFSRMYFPETSKSFGRANTGEDDKNFIAIDLINSEVGYTSIIANASVYRLICTNGMVAKKADFGTFKQRHIHIDPEEVNTELQRSIVAGFENGRELLHKFELARQVKVDSPYEMVTQYGKKRNMNDRALVKLREKYDEEHDKSLFGVINAFTRAARDTENLEKRIELEKYASHILDTELKKSA